MSTPEKDQQLLERTYVLVKENNKMLRSMQRRAFFGGILKLIFWAAMIGIPIWLYMTYLQPVITDLTNAVNQVQGTSAQVGAQLQGLSAPLDALKNLFPGGN